MKMNDYSLAINSHKFSQVDIIRTALAAKAKQAPTY